MHLVLQLYVYIEIVIYIYTLNRSSIFKTRFIYIYVCVNTYILYLVQVKKHILNEIQEICMHMGFDSRSYDTM